MAVDETENVSRSRRVLAYVRPYATSPVLWIIAAFIAAALWLNRPFASEKTLGTISVDSPEIYTRERLVNDRFLEDAWLSARLNDPDVHDALEVRDEYRSAAVSASVGKDPASKEAGAGARSGQAPVGEPRQSTKIELLNKVDYREVVRNLLIENQLDDRHDLNGNSLYKLKFDTAILPGSNTHASAHIAVRLLPPTFVAGDRKNAVTGSLADLGSQEDIDAWRRVYARWIESLRSRLNQTHRELKEAYRNNEFSHNDYSRLIGFLVQRLNVKVAALRACPAPIVDVLGQDSPSLRLSNIQHAERKACVFALVEQSLKSVPNQKGIAGFVEKAPKQGEYVDVTPLSSADRLQATFDPDAMTQLWLNSFFAARTVKLALGVHVHESVFASAGWNRVPALQNLAQLTFFNPVTTQNEGNDVFYVSEKIFEIPAVDPKIPPSNDAKIRGLKAEDFVSSPIAPERFLVSKSALGFIHGERLKFAEREFREETDGQGVYVASAEVGLIRFAKLARQKMAAFTYGVAPKESADTVHQRLSMQANTAGQAAAAGDAVLAARLQREVDSRSFERRSNVVGFSGVSTDPKVAQWGWVISPRQSTMDGMQQVYVQAPAQYSLSSLVSIPSWWQTARVEVVTNWVGKDGAPIRETEKKHEYDIDVPTDFEPLEALLLGIEQVGPELMESRMDPVWLTACRSGSIVIPGRRLWRSTKVTLGYQTADAISVLPNMKGIIATFISVDNQLSVPEEAAWKVKHRGESTQIQRAVRVWTSQGSLTLPTLATIGVPEGTPPTCPKQPAGPAAGK